MPNKGFQIEIEQGLEKHENDQAIKVANEFIKHWIEHDGSWKDQTRGGWASFLRRGKLGNTIRTVNGGKWDDFGLYFRRASRGRRIFQIVRSSSLKLKPNAKMDGHYRMKRKSPEDHSGVIGSTCMCPIHEGSLDVATKYGDIKTKVYATIGDIKG